MIRPPQFPLIGNQIVDGRVAIAAQLDRRLHFLAREPLAKPGSPMTGTRNEMMPAAAIFEQPAAECAFERSIHTAILARYFVSVTKW